MQTFIEWLTDLLEKGGVAGLPCPNCGKMEHDIELGEHKCKCRSCGTEFPFPQASHKMGSQLPYTLDLIKNQPHAA